MRHEQRAASLRQNPTKSHMNIHTQRLPQFALYAAHSDAYGLTVFGHCRDEAVNNLAEELAERHPWERSGQDPTGYERKSV